MELTIGKTYKAVCVRKGTFEMTINHQCDIWASGIITKGKTKALKSYNIVYAGEEVTVRKSFCTFTEV